MIDKSLKIYIAGHNGMVGSACAKFLKNRGYNNLIGLSSRELDLRDQNKVNLYIKNEKPYAIINAAAKVGGILANSKNPYEFLMENMLIQNNLINSAQEYDIPKFIFLGSSCIYPKFAPQPIKEEYLLTSPLEPTNEWYAIAKITGVKLIQSLRIQYDKDYVSLMPTNLYGPNDNFDINSSHVIPAMLRKFYEAKIHNNKPVRLWGTGKPLREFLHVYDLAEAIILALENKLESHLYNIGSGSEISIKDLAKKIQKVTGHKGEIFWDESLPDGTPRKLMESTKILKYGWKPKIDLDSGLNDTYKYFINDKVI